MRQYVTFGVGEEFLGVDISQVQEVLGEQPLTPVPRAPEHILGLINLRGQIVTALDLRKRLGLPPRSQMGSMNVIVRGPDGLVSLVVDEIGDVLELPVHQREAVPQALASPATPYLEAIHQLPERLLAILDVARLNSVL